MSSHEVNKRPSELAEEVQDMKIEADDLSHNRDASGHQLSRILFSPDSPDAKPSPQSNNLRGASSPSRVASESTPQPPIKKSVSPQSPAVKSEHEEIVGGEITVKLEPGQAPKLARSSTKKIIARPPPLFLDYADATAESYRTFEQISDCVYANKYLGTTDHALECDCTEEWDVSTQRNHACGDDSDCINRATKMECIGDCNCGAACQNQRFQLREYAKVTVIKTEKKGFGLRADTNLRPHDFIFEYIGEVIGEAAFRRRMVQYDEGGIKHFYFMSLNKGEFVDATKRGNLGRFCNHSCNPNCYVDKWVVGDKLRMGIFAERKIAKGEELVFNYNVDRYGANPQPCYCGEPNCTGFIGGKTQTERATKLSATTIEALGIEDGDGWDTAVAKKARRKKNVDEDDEEYVDSVQPKSLDESGVTKVMATLMQCKEKWIAVKLLSRIQRCDEERVINRVVKMHGYTILNSTLSTWIEDSNVVLQILDILDKLPRLTRNKIQDSKIEATVEKLIDNEHEEVKERSAAILKVWSSLEVGYRIPRMKRDPNAAMAIDRLDERRRARSRSRSRSASPGYPKGPSAPTGPRNSVPQRSFPSRPPPYRRNFSNALPAGWFSAQSNGKTYYYSANGTTTWQRPTQPANQPPPPPPPRERTNEQKLQDIINSITKSSTPKEKPSATASPLISTEIVKPVHKEKKEKWKSYSEEKKMKLYENTLFPHIKSVMDKFRGKLPKDDLKRFAKEIAKKLVASDFKNKRVADPNQISSKQEKQVKKYVKEYFEKAVEKKAEHDRKVAEKKARDSAKGSSSHRKESSTTSEKRASHHNKNGVPSTTPPGSPAPGLNSIGLREEKDDGDDIVLSENEVEDDEEEDEEEPSPSTATDGVSPDNNELKRKRGQEADETPLTGVSPGDESYGGTPSKKFRSETPVRPPTPPPPPPPQDFDEGSGETMDVSYGMENGLSPNEDISGSFTNEALTAVLNKSPADCDHLHDDRMILTPAQVSSPKDSNLNGGAKHAGRDTNTLLLDAANERHESESPNNLEDATKRMVVQVKQHT